MNIKIFEWHIHNVVSVKLVESLIIRNRTIEELYSLQIFTFVDLLVHPNTLFSQLYD